MKREKKILPNCNRCSNECKGKDNERNRCYSPLKPFDKWMLAELALTNPQGLHDTLTQLPFDVNLNFALRK